MSELRKKDTGLLKVAARIAVIFVAIVAVFAVTRDGGLDNSAIVTSPDEVAQPPEDASPISAVAAPADALIGE